MYAQMAALQSDPAVTEMLLQLLAALIMLLHRQHAAQQQQETQQQKDKQQSKHQGAAGRTTGSSSSSSSGQEQQQDAGKLNRQQLRADLLPIPAFHQDMLQLLPGGQAYLDAAATFADQHFNGDAAVLTQQCCYQAAGYVAGLGIPQGLAEHEVCSCVSRDAPMLSSAAIKLVLELQLLAAGVLQRLRLSKQQQLQQSRYGSTQKDGSMLLIWCNILLRQQVWAILQATGSSCLPPEVLQQAGLQLLQALAAPLQQLQLEGQAGELAGVVALFPQHAGMNEQLYVLRAAAAGLASPGLQDGQGKTGCYNGFIT
jgi:hypothetical protein